MYTRAEILAGLRQQKRGGRVAEPHPWFTDMGYVGLPQKVRFTPGAIREVTLEGEQGVVIASESMHFSQRSQGVDHAFDFLETDRFLWRRTRRGWMLKAMTSIPRALQDGKPEKQLMPWLSKVPLSQGVETDAAP